MLKMLWTSEYDKEGFCEFSKYFDINITSPIEEFGSVTKILKGEDLIRCLQGIDVFMCAYDVVTEDVLVQCPDLKLILSVRDGPEENIDVVACNKLGIPVISSSGRCTQSVAELTFCLIMLLARPVIKMNRYIRENGNLEENFSISRKMYDSTSSELFRKTLGIIGLGRNGYRLAQLSKSFNMKVIAYDPYVDKVKMESEGYEIVTLDEVMSQADYVALMARVTNETIGMISRDKIKLMKKTACLINTARGLLIDEEALLDALENDEIRGAALDALRYDYFDLNSRYLAIDQDKLIITPHMAGKTRERNWHQYQLLLPQFKDFIEGKPLNLPYTPTVNTSKEYHRRGGAVVRYFLRIPNRTTCL